jgi:tetratricopeptide (TPR) repeat protein
MGAQWRLSIERPKPLAAPHEMALLREALHKNPGSELLRQQLAGHLLVADAFDEVIALYDGVPSRIEAYSLLVQAHLARETGPDTRRAIELARLGEALSQIPVESAYFLAEIGKAQLRLGNATSARMTLLAALAANPADRNAFKRLATLYLNEGAFADVIALSERMLADGVAHSRLIAARVLAFARLGDINMARNATGFDAFFHRETLAAPSGWGDPERFNTALADELNSHPSLRYDRYGTASIRTWRIDEPAAGGSERIRALQDSISGAVEAYVCRISGNDHPWIRARPDSGILHNWCVITDGEGHEEWHVHQHGWLSGVYYVAVPDRVVTGHDNAGCIAFGLPEDLAGTAAARAFETRIERPTPGALMIFPSHCYHRTFAHGNHGRRICLAFDIWPG